MAKTKSNFQTFRDSEKNNAETYHGNAGVSLFLRSGKLFHGFSAIVFLDEMVKESTMNSDWQKRKENAVARGMGNIFPVYAERAKNAEVWDVEGKRYIDFAAGIAVVNTGHSHPEVVDAVRQQLEAFSHTCVMVIQASRTPT
jgi:hypothetical protein